MIVQKSASLMEQTYELIRDAIVNQTIKRNQIYSEKWFADYFGVSRTPVREALLRLRSEGLIDVLPNRGIMIHNLTLEDATQLFHMRAALEGYASQVLAEHCGELDAIRVLDSIGMALERCHRQFNHEDEMFIHVATIGYLNNPYFTTQFANMRAKMEIFWLDVIDRPNRREEIYQEHKLIYKCMCAGKAAEANQASVEHSRITLEKIRQYATFNPPPDPRPARELQEEPLRLINE